MDFMIQILNFLAALVGFATAVMGFLDARGRPREMKRGRKRKR